LTASNWVILIPALILAIVVGVVAGYYPAVVVSSFNPVQAFKGESKLGTGDSTMRKVLVAGQFVVTIALLASMAFVFRQIQFMQAYELNFNPEQVMVIPLNEPGAHRNIKKLVTTQQEIDNLIVVINTKSRARFKFSVID